MRWEPRRIIIFRQISNLRPIRNCRLRRRTQQLFACVLDIYEDFSALLISFIPKQPEHFLYIDPLQKAELYLALSNLNGTLLYQSKEARNCRQAEVALGRNLRTKSQNNPSHEHSSEPSIHNGTMDFLGGKVLNLFIHPLKKKKVSFSL